MSYQAPAGPRIFFKNPLSSGACGTTSFLRKEAKNCREAATTTLGPGPVKPESLQPPKAAVHPKNPPRPKGAVPYHSDAWSRSQPPAVQAGQMQYFTPLSFASWAALERFLAVSAPRTLAPSSDSKKGITWSMEHTSSFYSFLRARAASFSPSVPAAFK